jgi:Uma2 family endonuclease
VLRVAMTQPAQRTATYEDLLAVPEHQVAEILFGRLVTHPHPAPQYVSAATALSGILGTAVQPKAGESGGWAFMTEPKLHLGPHVLVPDLAAWRREKLRGLPEKAWIDVTPDWVCEVLSPSTERYDRCEKRTIYAKAGVGHLWFVGPRSEMLEAYELTNGKWLVLGAFFGDAQIIAPPFGDVTFPLGLLWPFDPPAEKQE